MFGVSAYGTHKITETPVMFESFTIVPEVPNRFPHWLVATRAVEIVHLTQKGNKKKISSHSTDYCCSGKHRVNGSFGAPAVLHMCK